MSPNLTLLAASTEARLQEIGSAEILVGIPSYSNADTVVHVVQAVSLGLAKHFSGRRAFLVNSDGGSSDGTPAIVARTAIDFQHFFIADQQSILHRIITSYHGIPGKRSAFRTIFEIARRLKAQACAVVDSDVRSISPEWTELLLCPIMEEGYE
ncbi:MAG: glycosyltransferase, partial [Nitrospirota bacterium]